MKNGRKPHFSGKEWPKRSAGFAMTRKVPVVSQWSSVHEVSEELFLRIKSYHTIDYIYVVDDEKKLVGVLSIKDLYRFSGDRGIATIARKKPLVTALPTDDLQGVAHLSLQHGIKSVPITDTSGLFLGVVTHDVLKEKVEKKMHEDMLQLAGVHRAYARYANASEVPLLVTIEHRLPWLLVGLLGGLFAAKIIGFFEHTIEANIILAAFIPLVVYIADAVGTQLEAFVIRDFALFKKLQFRRYFFKQLLVICAIGLILGSAVGVSSFLIYRRPDVSMVLGLSIVCATLSALFSGLLIPFVFRKFKSDPANGSGPIGTIIQDILSVLIYFAVASWLL